MRQRPIGVAFLQPVVMLRRAPRLLALSSALLLPACAAAPRPSVPTESWAFTAPWDPRSASSLRAVSARLDAAVLGWVALDSLTGQPTVPFPDTLSRWMPGTLRRLALVTTYGGGRFHPEVIRLLAADTSASRRMSVGLADGALRDGYRGLVLDFEEMTRADTAALRAVVATIAAEAHRRGAGPIVVAVVASDTLAYPARLFLASADLLLVMLYDQHWATSPPGAIASPDWTRQVLSMRVLESGGKVSRLVAALPLYGYQWRADASVAHVIGYDDARRLAAHAGVSLERDGSTSTLRAARPAPDAWELWVSDARLLDELRRVVAELGVRRIAYWRLGLEDPGLWSAP